MIFWRVGEKSNLWSWVKIRGCGDENERFCETFWLVLFKIRWLLKLRSRGCFLWSRSRGFLRLKLFFLDLVVSFSWPRIFYFYGRTFFKILGPVIKIWVRLFLLGRGDFFVGLTSYHFCRSLLYKFCNHFLKINPLQKISTLLFKIKIKIASTSINKKSLQNQNRGNNPPLLPK